MTKLDLTIVIPTFNEQKNVAQVFKKVQEVFDKETIKIKWGIVFVDDDSNDGTLDSIKEMQFNNPNVSYIERIGRRGLSSAISEGIVFAKSEYVVVMDADLQHDEKKLPEIFHLLVAGATIVICGRDFNRNIGLSAFRKIGSNFFNWVMKRVLKINVSDPLAGYFGVRRDFYMEHVRKLQKNGFKILFDLLSFSQGCQVVEISSEFKERIYGESKLSDKVVLDAIELVIRKITRDCVPPEFIMFCAVGLVGAILHIFILSISLNIFGAAFWLGQGMATGSTMVFNYFNNSKITFRNSPLKISQSAGLFRFMVICTLGALINIMSADYIFESGAIWWISGLLGAVIGAAWNFIFSKFFIWNVQ